MGDFGDDAQKSQDIYFTVKELMETEVADKLFSSNNYCENAYLLLLLLGRLP